MKDNREGGKNEMRDSLSMLDTSKTLKNLCFAAYVSNTTDPS